MIAEVNGQQLGVSVAYVQEIVPRPISHEVPNTPRHVRGVINLRGKVVVLADLRLRLGLPPASIEVDAMLEMLTAREQDHVAWLRELQAAVTEGRPFTLSRDPTQCAFGKWYYSYKPEDIGFASALYRLELPHRRIHAIAHAVLEHAERGDRDRAQAMIRQANDGDLRLIIDLFAAARTAFRESRKEVAIVLTNGRVHLALAVDQVLSVEPLAEDTFQTATPALAGLESDLITQVARRPHEGGLALLLNVEALLAGPADTTRL